ncbi:MAG: hypothetical protein ABIH38_04480 [Patescibacteria group bacterium]
MENPPKKSFLKRFWWLFFLVLIIIAAFLIYIFYQPEKDETTNNTSTEKIDSSEQNINTSISDIEEIDTSDWLTYRNEVAKFELKYPPENWKIEAIQGQDPETTLTPTFRYCGYLEGSSFLGFYVYDYKVDENTELESQFVVLDLDKILEQKYITLGNEKAIQTKFLRQRYTTPEEFIDVIHNSRPYRLFLGQEPAEKCENDPERTRTFRELQDKILSTFKFID